MAGEFFPAASAPNPGMDIGDVIFYNFTPEGRRALAEKRALAAQGVKQQLDEPGRMASHQGDDTYLGANNPFDLTQRIAPYQAQTGRMAANTDAGRLQHDKDWAPDRSALAWAQNFVANRSADTADKTAATSARNADTSAGELKFRETNQPTIDAQNWSRIGLEDTTATESNRHNAAQESIESERNRIAADNVTREAESSKDTILTHLLQIVDPQTAQAMAKALINSKDPAIAAQLQAEKMNDPVYRAMSEDQRRAKDAATHNSSEANRLQRATGIVRDGEKLDAAANKQLIDEENSRRLATAKDLRNKTQSISMRQMGFVPGNEGNAVDVDAVTARDLAVKKQLLLDKAYELETPLESLDLPKPDGNAPVEPEAIIPNSKKPEFRPTPMPPPQVHSSSARMNQLQDKIHSMQKLGVPIPEELMQEYNHLMDRFVA